MPNKVKVIVLRTAGTNCDSETVFAFERFGAQVDLVHINKLINGSKILADYHILAIPGGFSYGDDIAAGRILANELRLRLGEDIRKFISKGKPVIGICNGFQILVKAGILPGALNGEKSNFRQTSTLMRNDCGKFQDRWVTLKPDGRCIWTKGLTQVVAFPIAHGEGKFIPQKSSDLEKLKKNKQIIFRYCSKDGKKPVYPENPNGSVDDIAGITDKSGLILGLMPHPERHFFFTQHPFWTRLKKKSEYGDGAIVFKNGIDYVKKNLL